MTAIECALNILEEKGNLNFYDLWDEVCAKMNYDSILAKKKISQFHTDISLDGRFIALESGIWGLKAKARYDEVVINPEDIEEDAIPQRDDEGFIVDPDDEIDENIELDNEENE